MLVDVHCHHLPLNAVEGLPGFDLRPGDPGEEGELHQDGKRRGPLSARLTELSLVLEDSDQFGVDIRALCAPSWLHGYWLEPELGLRYARAMNDAFAEAVREHPTRFTGLATVPLQDMGAAIAELERAVIELGLKGVATNTHVNRRYFDDRSLWPFLEAAADLDAAVFFHPFDVVGVDRMDRFRLIQMIGNPHDATFALVRLILGGALDRVPQAKLCFVQVGGSLPAIMGRIDHTWQVRKETRENTELPPSHYLPRLFYDSIAHSPEPIEIMLRHVPDTQILMGSDYPWDMGEVPGQSIRALTGVSPESTQRMLGGNAARLLRLVS